MISIVQEGQSKFHQEIQVALKVIKKAIYPSQEETTFNFQAMEESPTWTPMEDFRAVRVETTKVVEETTKEKVCTWVFRRWKLEIC